MSEGSGLRVRQRSRNSKSLSREKYSFIFSKPSSVALVRHKGQCTLSPLVFVSCAKNRNDPLERNVCGECDFLDEAFPLLHIS